MAQTPGSESDKGRKYELSVVAFIASSLSQNENVVDYRIYSNLTKYYPFDDVVVEVDFKGSKGSQIYAIQTKSGNYKFDFWKYVYGYETIIGEVQEDKLQVWHFAAKNMEYFQQQLSKIKQSTWFGCKECSNTDSKDILRESRYYKLHPKNSDLAQHTNFFKNFYLFFDQPDTQKIYVTITDRWITDDSLHSYIEKYFANSNNNGIDKKSFEHELLRNRLYNYVVTPTKAIRFQHKAVDEWNRLTLTRDVTLVLNEKHTEEYIYGCMLQNKDISDIVNIDQWNRFVENEGKLDDIVKNYFKKKPYKVETLKDLIFQRWEDGKIPLILRIDAWLPALKEFLHLNKKYIAIVSDIAGRSAEIENNQLKVFRHLGDAETEELTKNIPVSLQGREPASLYEIVNEGEALKKAVTCLDVLNLIKPRKAYVNRKCLNGNDHMLFIIETENLPQRSLDEEQPSGTNIEIYCEPNQGCERYSEIRADPRYKSYKTFHLRSADDNKLTLISKTDSRGITQKGGGYRGLECFFVDENDENIYYMDNGDVIPIIGEVPIRSCWRYVPCHLRDVVKKNTPISIDGSTSNKISIEYGEHLLTEREFFSEDNGKMVIVTGEPGMGKTAFLHSLFYFYESKYYVLFVDLAQHQLALRDGKLISFDDLLNLSRDRCSSLPYNSFLTSLREYSNRLVVILDSFDEILAICEQNILEFIRNLENIGLHKIIIASRLTALDPLINDFEARTIKIEGINEQSNKDYNDIWNLDINNLRHMPSEFLTNPLYLNMLRTISEGGMNLGTLSRWDLYESVVKLKMEKYCLHKPLDENGKESILTKHGELALKVIFGSNKVTEKLEQRTNSSSIGIGFITHYDDEYPVFVHRTFAEFFVAKWLIKNIGCDDATYIYRLMLDTNQAFLLNIHSEAFPLHKAIIDKDFEAIERLCSENLDYALEVDGFGRSALHLAVIHAFSNVLPLLLQRLSQPDFNIYLRDKVMEWNCVDYFEKCKYINRSHMFRCFRFKEIYWNYYATHIGKPDWTTLPFSENFNDLYSSAICQSSIGLIRDLLRLKYSRDETFLKFREMCLHSNMITNIELSNIRLREEELEGIHLACIYSNIEIVRAYIDSRANFNKADKFNCLPLHYSIIAGQNEILKLVLENCEISSPYAGEHKETTILHMTTQTGDVDAMQMVLERVNTNAREKRTFKRVWEENTSFSNTESFEVHDRGRLRTVTKLLTTSDDFRGYSPLMFAVKCGSKDLVKMLIQYYADADRSLYNVTGRQKSDILELLQLHERNTQDTFTKMYELIECAIENKDEDIVEILLDHNAHVNLKDIEWGVLLTDAIHTKKLKLIEMLLQRGANTNLMNSLNFTCLTEAILTRKEDVVQLLLNYKADVNLVDKNGRLPLEYAITSGNFEIIELLLRSGTRIDNRYSNGDTPLIHAIRTRRKDIVQIVLDHNADVNFECEDGVTPLEVAITKENLEIIELLLRSEARIDNRNSKGDTPLIRAINTGKKDIVQLLLDYKVDVNLECEDGVTPLKFAIKTENLEIIELLLRSRARIDNRNSSKETPLTYAIGRERKNVVQLLLDQNVDVNFQGNNGMTPLEFAITKENLEIIELLLRSGARINNRNSKGGTPLSCAIDTGKKDIVQLLLDHNVDVNLECEDGETPLKFAIKRENLEIVELLLRSRARIDNRNSSKETPLTYAIGRGRKNIVQLLLHQNVDVNFESNNGMTPLEFAIIKKNLEIIELLLRSGARIDNRNSKGGTPLCCAIGTGKKDIVQLLLDHNVDVNLECEDYRTPLQHAIIMEELEVIELLLRSGARIDNRNSKVDTPIIWAINTGKKDIVQLLLDHNADVNLKCEDVTPLEVAIEMKNLEVIELLLRSGARIDNRNSKGGTPLICAINAGKKDIVQLLLDHNVDVNLECEDYRTPLQHAIIMEELEVIELLLRSGARIGNRNSKVDTPLIWAINTGKKDIVRLLLDHNVDVNLECECYRTPLQHAIIMEELEVIELLLRSGARIDNRNSKVGTPLICAINAGKEDIVQLLLDHNVDVNLEGEDGVTPLEFAIEMKNLEVIELLLRSGARINNRDSNEDTPLIHAIRVGKKVTVQLLLDNNADVNMQTTNGTTPLKYALIRENREIMELLLRSGARTDNRDSNGETPLIYAVRTKKEDIVQLLLDHGADVNLAGNNGVTPLDVAIDIEDLDAIELLARNGARSGLVTASRGNIQNAKMLLQRNANVNIRTKYGLTTVHAQSIKEDKESF